MKLLALLCLVTGSLTQDLSLARSPLVYPGYSHYSMYSQYPQYSMYPYHGGYGYNYSPYHSTHYPSQTFSYPATPVQPMSYAPAPAPAPAPALAPVAAAAPYTAGTVGSQFHAQDEFGNLNYGYANINSEKQEVGNTYGGVQGAYSYVDANGELQRVEYVADALGFRVADSRLPVAPTFNPEPLMAPEDTAEVKAAKAAHMAAVEAARKTVGERKRREAEPGFAYGFGTFHPQPHYLRLPYSHYNFYNYHGLPYYG